MSVPTTVLGIMERAAFAVAGPDVPLSEVLEAVTAARESAQTPCGNAGDRHRWLFRRAVHRAGMPSENRYQCARCGQRLVTDGQAAVSSPDAATPDTGQYGYADDYAVAKRFAF